MKSNVLVMGLDVYVNHQPQGMPHSRSGPLVNMKLENSPPSLPRG